MQLVLKTLFDENMKSVTITTVVDLLKLVNDHRDFGGIFPSFFNSYVQVQLRVAAFEISLIFLPVQNPYVK